MYKVYVIKQRREGSEVLNDTKTQTPCFEVACAAFWSLYAQKYDNNHLMLMTHNNKQINAYRFCSVKGDRDYVAPEQELKNG